MSVFLLYAMSLLIQMYKTIQKTQKKKETTCKVKHRHIQINPGFQSHQ